MIHTLRAVFMSAIVTLGTSSASGMLFFYDSFNYSPSGTSLGTAGAPTWTKNGTSPDPTVQSAGGLAYPGLQISADTVSLQYDGSGINSGSGAPAATDSATLSTGINTGSVYYSLLLKVTAVQIGTGNGFGTGANPMTGSFMAGLMTSAANTAPANGTAAAPLLIRSGDGTQFSATYQLGTSKTATAADRQFYTAQSFNVNDTVFIVLKYTFDSANGDSASLFIDPTPGSVEPAPQLSVSAGVNLTLGTPAGIKSFFVRNNTVEPDALLIDELRIGDTWQDVTPMAIAGIPGDFNHNGVVDAADYVVWRNGLGTTYTQADYNAWRTHFGLIAGRGSAIGANAAVPEPATVPLLIFAATFRCLRLRRVGYKFHQLVAA
jgi:hypothetical protein